MMKSVFPSLAVIVNSSKCGSARVSGESGLPDKFIENNNHTQTYCELFHQTIHKHYETHKTNRSINRATH